MQQRAETPERNHTDFITQTGQDQVCWCSLAWEDSRVEDGMWKSRGEWDCTLCTASRAEPGPGRLEAHLEGRQRRRFFRRFRAEVILFGSSIQSSLSKVLGLPPINRDWQASLQRQVTQLRQVTATDGMKHLKSPSVLKHKAPRPKGGWAGGEILNCCYSWEHFWCQNSLSIYRPWRLPAHQRVNQQKMSRESSK